MRLRFFSFRDRHGVQSAHAHGGSLAWAAYVFFFVLVGGT